MLAQTYSPVVGGEERLVEDLSRQLAGRGHEVAVATLRQPLGRAAGEPAASRSTCSTASSTASPGSRCTRSAATRRRCPTRGRPPSCAGCCARCGPTSSTPTTGWSTPTCRWRGEPAPPLVLSLHDYGLLCPTKRLFYKGGVCSGPGAVKCLRHAVRVLRRRRRGRWSPPGTRLSEPWVRRRVDMFLSVSSAVAELCRVGRRRDHRIVPNFVGELPAAAGRCRRGALDFLPEGAVRPLLRRRRRGQGGGNLLDAHAELAEAPPLVLIGRRSIEGLRPRPGVIAPGRCRTRWRSRRCAARLHRRPLDLGRAVRHRRPRGGGGRASRSSPPTIGGLRDIVVDGETGLLVPPGDRVALREAMRADARRRRRCASGWGGRRAERARELFSPEAVVPLFEDAYRDAIDARLKRGTDAADRAVAPFPPGLAAAAPNLS